MVLALYSMKVNFYNLCIFLVMQEIKYVPYLSLEISANFKLNVKYGTHKGL